MATSNYDYGSPSFLSQAFGSWDGSAPAANAGPSLEDLLQQSQINYYNAQPGLQQQQLDIARQAAKPPSGFATAAGTFGSIAQGLAGLGSIYLGLQGLKQQKKEFNFNKEVTNTNLNNSILDYNRRLTDVLSNRALNNGQGQGWVSGQMSQWQAKRSGG